MGLTPELAAEYRELFESCEIRPERKATVENVVSKLVKNLGRYQVVSEKTGVPPGIVGCIHSLEAGFDFGAHLHNGDPLTARTVHVPAGRPVAPPANGSVYTWEESAIDALLHEGVASIKDWSDIAVCLFFLERYNGFGYRNRSGATTTPPNRSPYLWSMTRHWDKGKFVADGHFDPNAGSEQVGGGAILQLLKDQGHLDLTSAGPQASFQDYKPAPVPLDNSATLKLGMQGADVFQLQCALMGLGIIQRSAKVGDVFDFRLDSAVKRLQAAHGLEDDGEVGPLTRGLIEQLLTRARGGGSAPSGIASGNGHDLRERVLQFARQEALKHRRQAPGNEIDTLVLDPLRPPMVKLGHLGASNHDGFFNWCASWVTYVLRNSGVKVPDQPSGFWATVALVDSWRFMAKKLGAWKKNGIPGDIVVYDWDGDNALDHIGIVLEVQSGGIVAAEGNHHNSEDIVTRHNGDIGGYVDLEMLAAKLN